MSGHTPEPWGAYFQDMAPIWTVAGSGGKGMFIAEVYGENDEADAYLIAAAPELLAACEAVLALVEKNDDPEMSEESLEQMAQDAADRIRAAIAKATS